MSLENVSGSLGDHHNDNIPDRTVLLPRKSPPLLAISVKVSGFVFVTVTAEKTYETQESSENQRCTFMVADKPILKFTTALATQDNNCESGPWPTVKSYRQAASEVEYCPYVFR